MVFLPKEREEYQGIGLVEIVWYICAAVVNFRIKRSVRLHEGLHRFRAGGGGYGYSKLEANLAQQLEGITNKPLFQVFLDVWKAYDSLNRGWCMNILWGKGWSRTWLASLITTGTTNSL